MSNNNETVKQVCDWLTDRDVPFAVSIAEVRFTNPHYDAEGCMIGALKKLADRIEAAHKREIAEKDAEIAELQRTLDLHDLYADEECEDADTARIVAEDVAAAKDAEIAELRNGIFELLDALQTIYNEECTSYGTEKVYNKWREALRVVKDEKRN